MFSLLCVFFFIFFVLLVIFFIFHDLPLFTGSFSVFSKVIASISPKNSCCHCCLFLSPTPEFWAVSMTFSEGRQESMVLVLACFTGSLAQHMSVS